MTALERELMSRGHKIAREVQLRVFYKGDRIASQRIDMLVDDKVIVELKATEILPPPNVITLIRRHPTLPPNVSTLIRLHPLLPPDT